MVKRVKENQSRFLLSRAFTPPYTLWTEDDARLNLNIVHITWISAFELALSREEYKIAKPVQHSLFILAGMDNNLFPLASRPTLLLLLHRPRS